MRMVRSYTLSRTYSLSRTYIECAIPRHRSKGYRFVKNQTAELSRQHRFCFQSVGQIEKIRTDQTVQDLVAFGFVNLAMKSRFSISDKHSPDFDNILKEQLPDQISVGCGWPGPKPTEDKTALIRLNAFIIPHYYNKTLMIIASGNQLGTFGSIHLETDPKLGKVLYFPVLKHSEQTTLEQLPVDVKQLLKGYR